MKPAPPECDAKVLTAMAVTFDIKNEQKSERKRAGRKEKKEKKSEELM